MSKLFKRSATSKVRTAYNYQPNSSLSAQEKSLNRRLLASFIVIVAITAGLYFWGIEIMIKFTQFWQQVLPNTQIFEPTDNPEAEDAIIFAPRLDPLPLFTQDEQLDIEGWAQPGVEVKVILNETELATILTDKSGRLEYTAKITEGENLVYAVVVENNVTSEPSVTQTITLDTQKPELSVTIETDNINEDGKVPLSGTTEPTANLFINDRRLILDINGGFTDSYQLQPGSNTVTILSVDPAGNETTFEQIIEYEKPDAGEDDASENEPEQ